MAAVLITLIVVAIGASTLLWVRLASLPADERRQLDIPSTWLGHFLDRPAQFAFLYSDAHRKVGDPWLSAAVWILRIVNAAGVLVLAWALSRLIRL